MFMSFRIKLIASDNSCFFRLQRYKKSPTLANSARAQCFSLMYYIFLILYSKKLKFQRVFFQQEIKNTHSCNAMFISCYRTLLSKDYYFLERVVNFQQ